MNNVESAGRLMITIICLLLFAAFSAFLLYTKASESTILMLAGALIAWTGNGISYFLGSSAGSSAKDKTITTLSNKP